MSKSTTDAGAPPAQPTDQKTTPKRLPVRQRVRPSPAPESTPDNIEGPGDGNSSYAVGYGKPPTHSQFKAGRSGNPRGRPKAAKGLKTIVRETMITKVAVRTAAGEVKMSRMEAVIHKTVELAMKGNPRALGHLISLYGAAVPEADRQVAALSTDELTPTDIQTLEELKASWLADAKDDDQ